MQIHGPDGKVVGVDDENRLEIMAITRSIEHHCTQAHGDSYSLPISVTPKAADDCIFYMKNTSDIDMVIEGLTFGCINATSDDSIYFKLGDSGTRDSATAVTPVNLNTGSGNIATGDFETGTDLEGAATLAGGTEFERIIIGGANGDQVSSNFNFSQDVILQKNGTFTIWVDGSNTGTYYLTINFHYHD